MAVSTVEHQGLFQTVRQLPFTIRFSLLEMLMQSIREDLNFESNVPLAIDAVKTEPAIQKRKLRGYEVRGMAKPNGPIPTKSALRDDYTDYLIQKYS